MTGHGNRFENVNVVHRRWVRLRAADAAYVISALGAELRGRGRR
jgi:hypothetical protein